MAFVNAADIFFGSYAKFTTPHKNQGAVLAGPDNAIGDIGEIEFKLDENRRSIAWMKNRFGHIVGSFDAQTSHTLAVLEAKGWHIRYVLSFVAFTECSDPDLNTYWGQAALFAYAPRYENEFQAFVQEFAHRAADGSRPNPALSTVEVEGIIKDPQSWKPSMFVEKPPFDANTILIKDRRSMHDKLLDQGRNKNPGCYVISWAFIILLIAGLIRLLRITGIF